MKDNFGENNKNELNQRDLDSLKRKKLIDIKKLIIYIYNSEFIYIQKIKSF